MRRHSKTPLFLMELVIMLLVFSISSAVCLQVFVGARKISDESKVLDQSVILAQQAAEYWKATQGDLEETAKYMGVLPDKNGFTVFYEEEWLQMKFNSEGTVADIIVLKEEEEIFSLKCEAVIFGG